MTPLFCCQIAVKLVFNQQETNSMFRLLACRCEKRGAPGRTRTCDMRLRRPPFCPLNYGGGFGERGGVVA